LGYSQDTVQGQGSWTSALRQLGDVGGDAPGLVVGERAQHAAQASVARSTRSSTSSIRWRPSTCATIAATEATRSRAARWKAASPPCRRISLSTRRSRPHAIHALRGHSGRGPAVRAPWQTSHNPPMTPPGRSLTGRKGKSWGSATGAPGRGSASASSTVHGDGKRRSGKLNAPAGR
jgi:hypothetical protein